MSGSEQTPKHDSGTSPCTPFKGGIPFLSLSPEAAVAGRFGGEGQGEGGLHGVYLPNSRFVVQNTAEDNET